MSDTVASRVVGVVKVFHIASLYEKINPVILKLLGTTWIISMKVEMKDIHGLIKKVVNIYQKYAPQFPFEYTFLNNLIDEYYQKEHRIFKTIKIFTILSILNAFIELFGLATFIAEEKQHEIGIRKVLGASSAQINYQVGNSLLYSMVIATLIAWPLTWYISEKWLENFAFRIDFPWDLYILSGLLTMIIAFTTIYFQVFKASRTNPAKIIKYE